MKLSLLILAIILLNFPSYSQLEKSDIPLTTKIAEVKSAGTFIAELSYYTTGNDTIYMITFRNLKYTSITNIKTVSFDGKNETLTRLYGVLIETLSLDAGKDNSFKLGETEVMVKSNKMLGVKYIKFFTVENGAYFQLTKKQIDKLFNRS